MLMKSLFFTGLMALLAVYSNAATTITPTVPAKDGGCYQISNANELYGFAAIVNGDSTTTGSHFACGELTANIVVNEGVLTEDGSLNVADTADFIPWTPIKEYGGVFDGMGHTISGLYVNDENMVDVGLFGNFLPVTKNVEPTIIRNLGIVGSFLKGKTYVGAIVGSLMASNDAKKSYKIENCFNSSRIEGELFAGGIAGYIGGLIKIKGCWNTGTISSGSCVGGIAGEIALSGRTEFFASVENSFNAGKVTGMVAGGIVSDVYENVRLMNCYNLGNVVGRGYAGGIVATFTYNCNSRIVNVYNAGKVENPDANMEEITPYLPNPIVADLYEECTSENTDHLPENAFFLNTSVSNEFLYDTIGVSTSAEMFENGAVAYLLRNYYYEGLNASAWGQRIGTDDYPDFSGSIEGTPTITFASLTLHTYDGDTTSLPQKYVPGYAFRLPPVNRDGYVFRGWFNNEGLTGDSVVFFPETATGEQEFWAKFSRISTVTFETGGGVLKFGYPESYIEGIGAPLPEQVTRVGYIFRGWYASDDFSGSRVREIDTAQTGDKVFYAKWFKKQEPSKDKNGCYVINDANELYGFAAIVNGTDGFEEEKRACAVLAADIVVNEDVIDDEGALNESGVDDFIVWEPIEYFGGEFDGAMHSISGLYYNDTSNVNPRDYIGLFGSLEMTKVDAPVVIKNVGVVGSYFSTYGHIGALVGLISCPTRMYNTEYIIQNSYSTSTVVNTYRYYGRSAGLVGYVGGASNLTIENTYNAGMISALTNYSGGIVGEAENTSDLKIVNSYNVGMVRDRRNSTVHYRLIGGSMLYMEMENCYYLENYGGSSVDGIPATREQFRDGSVVTALHGGLNGGIWGQDVGTDTLPNFSGKVENSAVTVNKVTFHTFDGDTTAYFQNYVSGLKRVLPDTVERMGYHFAGWYADSAFTGSSLKSIDEDATGDKEFFAKWDAVMVKVVWTSNNNKWGVVSGLHEDSLYNYNDTVYANATASEGYVFSYWMYPRNDKDTAVSFVATHDTILNAVFTWASSSSSAPTSSSSINSSSSKTIASSSSVAPKSSSSAGKSSTSAKSSSSKAQSSSSCEGKNCKSSEDFDIAPRVCTGKNCKDALKEYGIAPRFDIGVGSHMIHVYGAAPGKVYALFDAQGKTLEFGRVPSTDFAIAVALPGVYLIRIDRETRKVVVK